jgi:hypothetical protein
MSQTLDSLLQQAAVKLTLPQRSGWGTGVWVAPGQILTCYHVVQGSDTIQVWGCAADAALMATVEQTSPQHDLALLHCFPLARFAPLCVYLGEDLQTGDELVLFGYPDDYPEGAPATVVCEGLTGDKPPFIKFKFGQIRPGMSGAGLLNRRTGLVCGLVKFTRAAGFDLGTSLVAKPNSLNCITCCNRAIASPSLAGQSSANLRATTQFICPNSDLVGVGASLSPGLGDRRPGREPR